MERSNVVAIFGKNVNAEFFPHLQRMFRELNARGVQLVGEAGFAGFLRLHYACVDTFAGVFDKDSLAEKNPELLLSVGGDGTFLDSVLYVKDSRIPVLGINTGRLGFLANVSVAEMEEAARHICDRDYVIEPRDVLRVNAGGEAFPGFNYALNEVCVHKTESSSLLKIHAYVDGMYLTTYWADGLIVATPTGSTAYSLSGGGPIVSPDCKNVILTPICPHNLATRVLVIPGGSEIRLTVEGRSGDYMLSLDSRQVKMNARSEVVISPGDFNIQVVRMPEHNYYETLRNKLGWGEDKRNLPDGKMTGV